MTDSTLIEVRSSCSAAMLPTLPETGWSRPGPAAVHSPAAPLPLPGAADDEVDSCSFGSLRQHLTTSLCDPTRRSSFLEGKPWRPLGSWALFYALAFDLADSRYVLIPVTDDMLLEWGVGSALLHDEAMTNAALSPARLEYADEAAVLPPEKRRNLLDEEQPLAQPVHGVFRLSNSSGTNGASVVAGEGTLDRIGDVLGCDFVVVPFSVHELLILPAASDDLDLAVWRSGLRLFNASPQVMPPVDVLSDQLQLYERKLGTLHAV